MAASAGPGDLELVVRDLTVDFGLDGAARHATDQALREIERGRLVVAQQWRRVLNAIHRLA